MDVVIQQEEYVEDLEVTSGEYISDSSDSVQDNCTDKDLCERLNGIDNSSHTIGSMISIDSGTDNDVNGDAISRHMDFMPLFHQSSSDKNYEHHRIVISDNDGISSVVKDEDDSNEPTAKRVCIEEVENGQTYVRVEQDDGNTIVIAVSTEDFLSDKSLSLDMTNVGDTFTATSHSCHSPVLSTASDDGIGFKDSETASLELDVTQAWFTTKDDKSALHHKGYNWKTGQWSREEIDVLQSNINTYCKIHGVNDPTEIIFEMSKDERKDFYRTVARGLQRPLFSVYRRVIRMYDQRNHIGKYGPEELDKLRQLRQLHGSDWATIGAHLGRSASSVKDRCRLMKDTCKSGKWFPEEEHRLASAVYELSGAKPGDSITSGLSWSLVAEKVATRSEKQCRTKWLNYLNWKHRGGAEWTRDDDIYLIQSVMNADVAEESELDWLELSKGWPSARSPQWLRAKWWTLKRHVPDFQLLPFHELLICLKKIHVENQSPPKSRNFSPPSHSKISKHRDSNLSTVSMTTDSSDIFSSQIAGIVSSNQELEMNCNISGMVQNLVNNNTVIRGITNTGALLISSSSGIGLDHIVVQAVTNQLIGNGNMAVQMNPQSPLIIQSNLIQNISDVNLNNVSTLQTQSLQAQSSNEEAISNNLTCITLPNDDVIQNNMTCISVPHSDTQNNLTCINISTNDQVHMNQNSQDLIKGQNDLMINDENSNNSTRVQYTQHSSNDSDLLQMTSLSDPMLLTQTSDLIEHESFLENDKSALSNEENSIV